MNTSRLASVEVAVGWDSPLARHTDRRFFERVDFWRDVVPGTLGADLPEAAAGETAETAFDAGELVPAFDEAKVPAIRASQLNMRWWRRRPVATRIGRFYPRGMLAALPGIFPDDRRPFRYLGRSDVGCRVDLNHPLAQSALRVQVTVVEPLGAREQRGGRCNDLVRDLTDDGPGLQARSRYVDTDFFSGTPFARLDERDDALFYAGARLVDHLDATARARLAALYRRFLVPGMRVLDLMSAWNSHLPADAAALTVTGLGMNGEELAANPRLAHRVVHDLNRDPRLPFDDAAFDIALCSLSVEYLTRPLEVFAEVARTLAPGAPFIVSFSDRWFPPKAIRLWTELHPFERMGLVVEYFRRSGGFTGLETESLRGLPRPDTDKYASSLALADPLYVIWGRVPAPHPSP